MRVALWGVNAADEGFQSSPPPKERCNTEPHKLAIDVVAFQSSPPPKERCNVRAVVGVEVRLLFQSSPPPKERCNTSWAAISERLRLLSILTAPEGAVQCATPRAAGAYGNFQSSPPPKERCNP